MRTLAFLLAMTMSTTAFADTGALSPGKPAGVREAQFSMDSNLLLIGVGVGVIAAIAVIAASGGHHAAAAAGGTTTTTTTTSSTAT